MSCLMMNRPHLTHLDVQLRVVVALLLLFQQGDPLQEGLPVRCQECEAVSQAVQVLDLVFDERLLALLLLF